MSQSLDLFWEIMKKTDPPKLKALSIEKLQWYQHYLSEKLPTLPDQPKTVCQNRIDLLAREIQEKREDQRHQKDLFWQKVGIGIGIGAILIAVAGLSYDIFSSKAQRAKTEQASPPTFHQTPAPTVASPEPEASSNTSTPSPQQSATAPSSVDTPSP